MYNIIFLFFSPSRSRSWPVASGIATYRVVHELAWLERSADSAEFLLEGLIIWAARLT
jgi:hypothetical protein